MASQAYYMARSLCIYGASSEHQLLSLLRSVLNAHPEVLNGRSRRNGSSIMHYAAHDKTVEVMKVIVEANGGRGRELVRTPNRHGYLPIHWACFWSNFEVVKYLLSIYPESINMSTYSDGYYPLHKAIDCHPERVVEGIKVIQYLLEHDQGAVSTATMNGRLALHLACSEWTSLDINKMVYNKYPQAIHQMDNNQFTPIDVCGAYDTSTFLERQSLWVKQAAEGILEDNQNRFPLFSFLRSSEVTLGTAKLMVNAHPMTLRYRDFRHCNPIHYACAHGHVQIVNYILDMSHHGVASYNREGKLPIELLLFRQRVNRDSLSYVEAVFRLLLADPNVVRIIFDSSGGSIIDDDNRSGTLKRKYIHS